MEKSKARKQDRECQNQGLSILNSVTRKGLTEKVIFVQRPDAGYGATICGKQKFQAKQQVAAGTLLQRPWMETFPEDWKNCKKASSSGRVRVEGSEVKEGTGASESDFDIH